MKAIFVIFSLFCALPVPAQEAPASQPVSITRSPFFFGTPMAPLPVVDIAPSELVSIEALPLDTEAPSIETNPTLAPFVVYSEPVLRVPAKRKSPALAVGLSLLGVAAPFVIQPRDDIVEIDMRVRALAVVGGFAPMAGAIYSQDHRAILVGSMTSIARTSLFLGLIRLGLFMEDIPPDGDGEGYPLDVFVLMGAAVVGLAGAVTIAVLDAADLTLPAVLIRNRMPTQESGR